MAYLFLSQHHEANAREWSCDTYGSEEYEGLRLSANTCQHALIFFFNGINIFGSNEFFTCKEFKNVILIYYKFKWLLKSGLLLKGLLALKKHCCMCRNWTSIKFVPLHLFLIRFTPFLDLCRLCTKPDPAQTHVDCPPKVNWPVSREGLDSLHSDRVQCIAELLTCSDS